MNMCIHVISMASIYQARNNPGEGQCTQSTGAYIAVETSVHISEKAYSQVHSIRVKGQR